MADLDAELLALAGGDDSSDEETSVPGRSKDLPPPQSPSREQHPDNQAIEMGRKGMAKPVKRRRRARDEEEEEEGELSSSTLHSRKSLDSASMSESESESEAPPPGGDREGPVFPFEKLYYSAKDKAEIMAMPEIQREELLAERAQLVDRHNQDIALRRLLAMRERDVKLFDKRKRKASDTDGQRKSSRQKTTLGGRKVGETSGAIEAYKRQREQKGKRDEQRRRDASKRKKDESSASGEGSDLDAHGESEVEWDEPRRKSSSPTKDDPPAEFRDFERARVSRRNFAQYCFYPNFDKLISGCYTRVNVGPHPDTGELVYRLCLIKGFTEGRPYALEGTNGRKFVTTLYAVLEHGKSKKEFPFIFCSDSPFTESEFNRYRQTIVVEGFKMPTKSILNKKISDIHYLINYQLSKTELEEKLKRQGTHDNKMAVFQRIQLQKRRQEAIASGDETAIAECDAEIARLSGPKLAFGTSLVEPRSTEKTQQERLADLNRRNQKLNTENVRKAQIEERRAARLQQAAVARGEALPDRFARVKTRARTHYDANGNHLVPKKEETAGSATPLTAGANTPNKAPSSRGDTPVTIKEVKEAKPRTGIPKIRYAPNADEILAASLDFEIDIEI